jgi:hypothetical protein
MDAMIEQIDGRINGSGVCVRAAVPLHGRGRRRHAPSMAKFGPMIWSGHGLEVYASPKAATKRSGRKVWIRIQGSVGSTFRVYQSLNYARSVDVCFQVDVSLRPRKKRRTGP